MSVSTKINWGYFIIVIVTLGLLVLGLVMTFRDSSVIVASPGSSVYYFEQSLPSIFLISSQYDIPKRNSPINNSLENSIADYLEMSYRFYGINNQYFQDNQYVRFSSKFIFDVLSPNNTFHTVLDFLHSSNVIKNFQSIALPDAAYKDTSHDINNLLKNNVVQFSLDEQSTLFTISDIKTFLLETNAPLLFSFNIPNQTLYNSPFLPSNDLCDNSKFIETKNEFLQKIATTKIHGVIVGWNNYYPSNIGSYHYLNSSQGGFIVKMEAGNAISKYDGTLISKDNSKACPNDKNPENWIPIDINCLRSFQNISKCTQGATILKCIMPLQGNESVCNSSYSYALVGYNQQAIIDNGYYRMISYNQFISSNYSEFVNENVSAHLAGTIFQPINNFLSDPEVYCSYRFVPYDLLNAFPDIEALSLSLKWTKSSYQRSSDSRKYDSLQHSTFNVEPRPNSTIYNNYK